MDQRTDDLQQSIEETRHDIEETRASMTEKLELLEERVRETIEGTRTAVEDIVENVKETVDETVEAVKETVDGAKSTVDNIVENVRGTMDETVSMVKQSFDLRYQVEQHPWLMFGGAIFVGGLLGNLRRRNSYAYPYAAYEYDEEERTEYRAPQDPYPAPAQTGMYTRAEEAQAAYQDNAHEERADTRPSHRQRRWGSSWRSSLGQFQEEWDMIKGAALGILMGTLKEMVRQNMPRVAPKLEEAIDSASAKLGTEPIESSESQHPQGGNSHTSARSSSSREQPSHSRVSAEEPRDQGNLRHMR